MKKYISIIPFAGLMFLAIPALAQVPPPGPAWFQGSNSGAELGTFPACTPELAGHKGYVGPHINPAAQSPVRIYESVVCMQIAGAWGWVRAH